jgi:hypothetical protein
MTDAPITTPREGGCQCGRIRYRIDSALSLAVCHCRIANANQAAPSA